MVVGSVGVALWYNFVPYTLSYLIFGKQKAIYDVYLNLNDKKLQAV